MPSLTSTNNHVSFTLLAASGSFFIIMTTPHSFDFQPARSLWYFYILFLLSPMFQYKSRSPSQAPSWLSPPPSSNVFQLKTVSAWSEQWPPFGRKSNSAIQRTTAQQFTLYTLNFSFYILHFTLYTFYILHFTFYTLYFFLYNTNLAISNLTKCKIAKKISQSCDIVVQNNVTRLHFILFIFITCSRVTPYKTGHPTELTILWPHVTRVTFWSIWICFLDMLAALHFIPISRWIGRNFELA